jgi:hypothetical protein
MNALTLLLPPVGMSVLHTVQLSSSFSDRPQLQLLDRSEGHPVDPSDCVAQTTSACECMRVLLDR